MMTQHARAPRLFSFIAGTAMVVLVGLTFTGAAEKEAPPPLDQNKEPLPPSANKENVTERAIGLLEKELGKIEVQTREKQAELDALKSQLKISAFEEMILNRPDSALETIRYLERSVIDAKSAHQQLSSLYEHLKALSRVELRKALPTASPDAALTALIGNQALYQQQLVLKQVQLPMDHPEIQALQKVLEKIDQAMEERIEGIMLGLKTRMSVAQATTEQLEAHLAETKEKETTRATELRPLSLAKRDLETLLLLRERLQIRIMQEKVDAALP